MINDKKIYEIIDMTDWKKKPEILRELKLENVYLDERSLRQKIKDSNKLFFEHEIDIFIAHSGRGYKATQNRDEILKSVENNHKRAINMLYEEAKVKKALGENNNFKLIINDRGMFYVKG